jgi:16S rRNA (cytidine1402-2'-O)-methyltransferase
MLYLVATPIGNREDITLRALKVLREADIILAEDTRKTGSLLKHYEIPKKRFLSFHEHNEYEKLDTVIDLLNQDLKVVVVSNAGMPGISDPGYLLVQRCRRENIPWTVVSGASAVINSLLLSGLPVDKFSFLGFLPKKSNQRKKNLKPYSDLATTLVIYESPYRLVKLLNDLVDLWPDKECAVVREITKIYEEVKTGTPGEILAEVEKKPLKGEMVVLVNLR